MGLEGLSLGHILVVLLVVVLVFGTKKLRNVGSDLGHAIRDFKKAMNNPGSSSAEEAKPAAAIAQNEAREEASSAKVAEGAGAASSSHAAEPR